VLAAFLDLVFQQLDRPAGFLGRDDAAVALLVQQIEDPLRVILVHHDVGIGFGFKGNQHSFLVESPVTKR